MNAVNEVAVRMVELGCIALIVAGVAFIYWPAALIVAGVFGFVLVQATNRGDA